MIENKARIGNFTNSKIYHLCGGENVNNPTAPFYTYVEEKIFERKLKRSLDTGAYSQAMAWGSFLEKRLNDSDALEGYQMQHKTTTVHHKHLFWAGSVDFLVPRIKIAELKCFQPKKFAAYVSALLTNDTEIIKKDFPAEYWQMVGNACIHKVPKMEAIVYMPYESEMDEIRESVEDPEYLSAIGMQSWQVRFIAEKPNSELAVLPNDSEFVNLNRFEFEVPIKDIMFLTKRVIKAGKLLNG